MTNISLQQAYGINVRKFRVNKGYSLRKLSQKSNIATSHISAIESGKRGVSSSTLEVILKGLDVDTFTFLKYVAYTTKNIDIVIEQQLYSL